MDYINNQTQYNSAEDLFQNQGNRQLIYSKLKENFSCIENINIPELFANSSNLNEQISYFIQSIPDPHSFDHKAIQHICEAQEKKIYNKIQELKQADIYEEINKINPELKLKEMNLNQLANKLSEIQDKMKETTVKPVETQVLQPIQTEEEHYCYQEEEENIQNMDEQELTSNFLKKLSDMSKVPGRRDYDIFDDNIDMPQMKQDWNYEYEMNDCFNNNGINNNNNNKFFDFN